MDHWFDDYKTEQPKGFTPERFAKWLREHPNDKLVCGNPNSCAIAQWVADELSPEEATWVEVEETVTFFDKEKRTIEGFYLPDWATDFIAVFDEGSLEDVEWDPEKFEFVDSSGLPEVHQGRVKGGGNISRRYRTGAETIKVLNYVTGRKFRLPKAA